MGESKTLILIDGHALAFREYYALERTNMKTKDGTPTWAVYGFFKAIFDLLKNEKLAPDAIGVAFDVSHHTFRTEKYTEYKAMPDPMRIQMGLIYDGLKAFNIPIYTKEGFEADDVIGTISKRACELGHKVLILTGDQDSFQLVDKDGCVKVIIPSKGELVEYNWDKVYEKLGVYPNQVIDYKALRGDTSDNIPGIRGIGEKTAVKLLSEFQTVENVLNSVDKISGKSLKEKIQNGREQAELSKYLATIVRDVDVPFDFEKTNIELPNIAEVTEFLRSMQFYSFLKNIEFILKSFDKSGQDISLTNENNNAAIPQTDNSNGQLGLFAQAVQTEVNKTNITSIAKLVTDSQDFKDMIEKLSKATTISLRVLADVKNAINSTIYGIAFGINKNFTFDESLKINMGEEKTEAFYIPISHNFENQLSLDFVLENLKPIIENSKIKKLTHDVKVEYNIFKSFDINLDGVIFDTMLASYIKDTNASSVFDIQCMERIDHILPTMVSENKKMKFSDYDVDFVKNYTGDVISSLFELTKYWVNSLDEKEYKILRDIELPMAKVLADMEFIGVSIDEAYLKTLTEEFDIKARRLAQKIYDLAGEEFNLNSPKQVGEILFDKLQLKARKKRGKSKNSTSAEVLTQLAEEYDIAKFILDYRKYTKLKSTYTEALPLLVDKKDNRIHTTYNQTVTTTGRLSSSNPNLQNIPIRTEEGNKIRNAFVPRDRENYLILSADYSQIELRLLAHVSGDEHLINAFKSGVDVHTLTASKVFDVPIEKVTKDMRYKSKAVNFGIVYGQKIKSYMEDMVALVEEQGYVETVLGRKRYLEKEISSPNAMIREFAKRAAINQPMQGSASDLIKLAMIDFSNKLKENNLDSKLIMQVKELVLKSMELGQQLQVPLLVDVNVGESWKES